VCTARILRDGGKPTRAVQVSTTWIFHAERRDREKPHARSPPTSSRSPRRAGRAYLIPLDLSVFRLLGTYPPRRRSRVTSQNSRRFFLSSPALAFTDPRRKASIATLFQSKTSRPRQPVQRRPIARSAGWSALKIDRRSCARDVSLSFSPSPSHTRTRYVAVR